MQRIEINVVTGKQTVITFTPEEDAAAIAYAASVAPTQADLIKKKLADIDRLLNAQRWAREGILGLGTLIDLLRAAPEVTALPANATLAEVIAKVNECAALSAYLRAIPAPGSGMAKLRTIEEVTARGLREDLAALG